MNTSPGIAEDVYQRLQQRVMRNDVTPGARIIIDQVAAEFGVSSTPVREALAQLEARGLVTKERLRGYRYAERITPDAFDQLWEFRALLEPNAARQAAARTSLSAKARLDAELQWISEHLHEGHTSDSLDPMSAFMAHDQRFHDLILELAGNAYARSAIQRANVQSQMLRLHFDENEADLAAEEHRRISDAVISGDAAGAEAAMRAHLEGAFTRLRPYV